MTERAGLDRYLPFLLFRAHGLLSKPVLAEIEAMGHSVAEWRILATLADRDGMTIGELADLTMLPQPTASRWIDRLKTSGHLERSAPEHDRRQTVVHLTVLGQRTAVELINAAEARAAQVVHDVPPETLRQLDGLLHELIAALHASATAPADVDKS